MELKDILQQMMWQTMRASQPTDLQVGTVTSASPLEITISPTMAPLRSGVLYLTSAVVEKKITALSHSAQRTFLTRTPRPACLIRTCPGARRHQKA